MAILLTRVLAAAVAVALLTGAGDKAQITRGSLTAGQGKPPINWEARSASLDYETHLIHLRGDVKISQKNPAPQGEISIEADEAQATSTSKDSKSQHWVFTGKVHVRAESQGDLHSDHATLEISNGELASALVTGSPAQFEQTRSSNGRLVRGHAATINYDVATATVKLTGDAWLTDDHNENDMKAPSITYNVRDRQIQGESDKSPSSHVHMTILPRPDPGSGPATSAGPEKP
jgi:lipopolysaccharide transport protein LptA